MVSSTLCPAMHILGSQNVYGRAEGIADHYWPWAVFFIYSCPSISPGFPLFLPLLSPALLKIKGMIFFLWIYTHCQTIVKPNLPLHFAITTVCIRRFLDASSHLYNRVCPSVAPSVRRLVGDALVKIKENHYFRANNCRCTRRI